MADKIIPNLPKSEAPTFDDLMLVVDTPASTPTNKKVTLANLFNKIPRTIGYGTEAVGTVNISSTTQALDDTALFLCTDIATGRILIDNTSTNVGTTADVGDDLLMEDGDFIFLEGDCIATMSDGSHVGQTTTIILVAGRATDTYSSIRFKVTPSNFLDHSAGSNTKISLPKVGDSATLVWTGSNWITTSLIGTAITTT